MRMRRVHLTMRTEGITAFSNRYGVLVWTGENDTKTISVDANLFEKTAPFPFENGLVWAGPKSSSKGDSHLTNRFGEKLSAMRLRGLPWVKALRRE